MTYRLPDEPRPGALAHLAVHPTWPLFGLMFGGAWLSWPWFVLNGFAVGSPTRRRELLVVLLGLAGTALLVAGVMFAGGSHVIETRRAIRWAMLVPTGWKLAITYALYILQARTFEIHEHYGGVVRNGILVVVASTFVAPVVLKPLPVLVRVVLQ